MGKESRSLLQAVKEDINKSSGSGFVNFFGIRESGAKVRVRFLNDFEDGLSVVFHDKWNGFNHPCLAQYGKHCPNCNNPEGRTATVYYWNVYNYETKKVEIFGYKANKASPIPGLATIYEELGDITSQDIIVQKNGTGTSTSYAVIPTGKVTKFAKEVKLFSEKKIMKILFDTFNNYGEDADDIDEEDYDDEDFKSKRKKAAPAKSKKKPTYDEDDEDEGFDDEDDDEEDEPAPKKKAKAKPKKKQEPEYDEDDDFEDDDDEEEEEPPKKKSSKKPVKKSKKVVEEEEEDDDDELPFLEEDEEEEEELPPPKKKKRT